MHVDRVSNQVVTGIESAPPRATSSEQPAEAPGLMPELNQLACGGDPGAMLAALTMQAAKSEREVSRTQRDNAEKMQQADEAKEIQDLRDKADLVRIQGFVDGFTQMASAAFNLGSGLADAHAAGDQAQAEAAQNKLDAEKAGMSPTQLESGQTQITDLKQDAAACKADSAWDRAGAEGLGAGQKIADGFLQGAITDKDTDAKVHDMAAQTAKRMAEDARSDEGDAKQLMEKALEFLKEYNETRAQTTLAATHRA